MNSNNGGKHGNFFNISLFREDYIELMYNISIYIYIVFL